MVWEDTRNNNKNDIFCLPVSGTLIPEKSIVTTPDMLEKDPDIVARPITTEYLVAWQAKADSEPNYNIYAQRIDCECTPLPETNIRQISFEGIDQVSPAIVYLSREEKYLVVWSGQTLDQGFDIFAQVVETEAIPPPRIVVAVPKGGNVPISTAAITITFNKAMLTSSVNLTITPVIPISGPSWYENDQIAVYTLESLLEHNQIYTVEVNGEDKYHTPITKESGINPWSFTTIGKVYLPLITKPAPTELFVFNNYTGGNLTFIVRKLVTEAEVTRCIVGSGATIPCDHDGDGSNLFPPGIYEVQAFTVCGGDNPNPTINKIYTSGPQTTTVSCK